MVKSEDVVATIGFAPTYVEQGKWHTTEWYCWWGKIPVLSTWKRYITVVYVGEPRRFSSHYLNEAPPEEALPGTLKVQSHDAGGTSGGEPATGEGGDKGPSDPTKVEVTPIEGGKPAEDKPAETKPADDKPAAEEKPAAEKPAEDKPAETKPAEDKPATEEKAAEKPAEEKAAADKSAAPDESAVKPQ